MLVLVNVVHMTPATTWLPILRAIHRTHGPLRGLAAHLVTHRQRSHGDYTIMSTTGGSATLQSGDWNSLLLQYTHCVLFILASLGRKLVPPKNNYATLNFTTRMQLTLPKACCSHRDL